MDGWDPGHQDAFAQSGRPGCRLLQQSSRQIGRQKVVQCGAIVVALAVLHLRLQLRLQWSGLNSPTPRLGSSRVAERPLCFKTQKPPTSVHLEVISPGSALTFDPRPAKSTAPRATRVSSSLSLVDGSVQLGRPRRPIIYWIPSTIRVVLYSYSYFSFSVFGFILSTSRRFCDRCRCLLCRISNICSASAHLPPHSIPPQPHSIRLLSCDIRVSQVQYRS